MNSEGELSTRQSECRGQLRKGECGEERMQLTSNRASALPSGGSKSARCLCDYEI